MSYRNLVLSSQKIQSMSDALSTLDEASGVLPDSLVTKLNEKLDTLKTLNDKSKKAIQERPLVAIGVTAVLAGVLGYILGRKMKRS